MFDPKLPRPGGYRVGFLVKNSWGLDWGEYGLCFMTPEYLSWKSTTDLWVPTKGSEFR